MKPVSVYNSVKDEATYYLQNIYNALAQVNTAAHHPNLLGPLEGYLQGNVKFDKEKLRINFSIGTYKFFINTHLNLSTGSPDICFYTYEEIEQTNKKLSTAAPKVVRLRDLRTLSKGRGLKLIEGENDEWGYLIRMYCKRLVDYIKNMEYDIDKPGN